MRQLVILALALLGLLVPAEACAGVTLHYDGTARTERDVAVIVDQAIAFAKAKGWSFERRATGVVIRPHAWSEPVALDFEGRQLPENWVKTQFAGPEVHIGVVELFRLLEPRFEQLSITDEGEYWETSNREKLMVRMQSDGLMMVRLQEKEPGSTGPYLLANGRVVDVVSPPAGNPSGPALVAAQLKEVGARLLAAPLVPPRPWIPKVPRLAASPADRWHLLEFKEYGVAASFPCSPERSPKDEAVTCRTATGGVVFMLFAGKSFEGDNAAQSIMDFGPVAAEKFVGQILADERLTQNGLRERRLRVLNGGAPVSYCVLTIGSRPYVLMVGARGASPADEDVRRFFDSLRALE